MIRLELLDRYSPALLESNRAFSFLNFASIGSFIRQPPSSLAYFCDGMLMSGFMSRITGRAVQRVSFDFTSIADPVLRESEQRGKRVYVVGAQQAELDRFVDKLGTQYPRLQLVGARNGYFDAEQGAAIQADICRQRTNLLLVGLGADQMRHAFAKNQAAQQHDRFQPAREPTAATGHAWRAVDVGRVAVHDEKTHPPTVRQKLLGEALLHALDAAASLVILEREQNMHRHNPHGAVTLIATCWRRISSVRRRALLG